MCHKHPLGRFEAELAAVIQQERGLLAQLCNVAGLDYSRMVKTLNERESHQMRPDEFVALLRAGSEVEHPGVVSIVQRVAETLQGQAQQAPPTNGSWHDEALRVMESLATVMLAAPTKVSDMTPGELSRVRAVVLKQQAELSRLLRELDTANGRRA